MPKFLLSFLSLILLVLSLPPLSFAQEANTFDCDWTTVSVVNNLIYHDTPLNSQIINDQGNLDIVLNQAQCWPARNDNPQSYRCYADYKAQPLSCIRLTQSGCNQTTHIPCIPRADWDQINPTTLWQNIFVSRGQVSALPGVDPYCNVQLITGQRSTLGIKTALGCIPTDPQAFVQVLFPWALGIAGTAAFLLIAFGAFSYITSAGNPEKLDKAKEIIVSAITGLVIIIFSVLFLRIIGVDILGLPSLNP